MPAHRWMRPRRKSLIARTKAGIKLQGYRGKPALHEPSVVKALVGLSNLMADAGGRIASIDVNPFLINPRPASPSMA